MSDHSAEKDALKVAPRDPACTCPHDMQRLGRLDGFDMGIGPVRVSTTPDCPVHDACQGFTREVRAASPERPFWCPIHDGDDCPLPPGEGRA